MKLKYLFTVTLIILTFFSCRKNPWIFYLKADKNFITIGATAGQYAEVLITSNVEWEATIKPGNIDWLQIDKSAGRGNSKLKLTVTKDLNGNIFREALLEIKAKNNPTVPKVTITVEQNSTGSSIVWQKTFGGSQHDVAMDALPLAGGGYMIAGYTLSNNGDVSDNKGWTDGWLVKMDDQGNRIWSKTYGGSSDDHFTSFITMPDGGSVVTGYSASNNGDVPGNKGETDVWILRLNNSGTVLWKKNFGGSNYDMAHAIAATPDGGIAITGTTESNDGDLAGMGHHGLKDMWVLKLNSNGDLIWQKMLGGSFDESSHTITVAADGNILIAGYAESTDGDLAGSTMRGFHDAWMVKLNNTGTVLWKKTFGGNGNESIHSIVSTADGGIIASGYSQSSTGDVSGNHGKNDAWAMKLNNNGAILWSKSFGGTEDDGANSILPQADGGFIIAGFTASKNGDITKHQGLGDIWVFKLNNNGNLVWSNTFGGSQNEAASFILSTTDNNFLTGSYSISQDGDVTGNDGLSDYWILKFRQ
jgi:hypothetical protein